MSLGDAMSAGEVVETMRILLAEDDPDTLDVIATALRREEHDVETAVTGNCALDRLLGGGFDLVVLDRMLPGIDGLAVLQRARKEGVAAHILMLTALGGITERVEGLDAGADDYLIKPFAMTELLARIHALQRRVEKEGEATTISHGPFRLNIMRRELRMGSKAVPLQPRELRLFEELLRGGGEIVTRTMLLERVWGYHFEPQTNLVETHMSRLRSKLALSGAKDVIRTVRGAGYRIVVEN